MNFIKSLILNHILASASVMAVLGTALAKLDDIIRLALRFVPKSVIEAELKRLEALAEAEVEKVAQEPPKAP